MCMLVFYVCIYVFIFMIRVHDLFGIYELTLNIYMFYTMHELRESFYNALIFSLCIYNSMSFIIIKKRKTVGQKAYHSSFDDH